MTTSRSAFLSPQSVAWLAAFVAIVAIYFFGLTIPLVGPDEARYAQVAREMFERGDWITPTLGGFNWFEKPALLYWLQIASYHLFGVNEFAARFGSALCGLGSVASLWVLGCNFATEDTEKRNFGNWLALIAASSIGIIVFSRGASFDIILTFPMTAALVSFFVFHVRTGSGSDRVNAAPNQQAATGNSVATAPGSDLLPLILFYFFIGLALLAKGLVGIVFPFAIVAFYHVLSWKWPGRTFIFSLFWGTVISITVASAWYLPMYLTHGWAFIDEFFIQHHFQRYTSNKYFHPQPFYFFLWVLPLMTLPWLPFFFGGVWAFFKDFFNRRDAEERRGEGEMGRWGDVPDESPAAFAPSPLVPISPSPLLLFSIAWLLVPLVFFSFSGSKLPGYILPSLPPALIIAAFGVVRFIGTSERRKFVVIGIIAASFAIVVALLLTVVPKFAVDDSVKGLIAEADKRGYGNAEVVSQHTVSHNAEFYAAGRLLRDKDGKQMRLYGPSDVLNEIRRRNGETMLVLVPNEFARQTLDSPLLNAELIAQTSELSIIAATERGL
jgi:4-amino-4-deoxy-L-arabinose transferase-like glycosyltransferase